MKTNHLKKGLLPLLAAGLLFGAGSALAQECEVTVDSNDAMQFDKDRIEVSSDCEQFTLRLTHSGQLPEQAMGHNWVLSVPEQVEAIARDGIAAGLENEYVKPNDERVIAHTDIIGGGEETSVSFDVSELNQGEEYMFFCSFPGHSAVMRGMLVVSG